MKDATINMQKKSSVKEFFNKPAIRALVNGVIDLALAVYTAVIREWNSVAWCILSMLIILDLFVIIYYGTQTINYRASISKLQETNKRLLELCRCYESLVINMGKSCETTVDKASDVIDDARKQNGHPSLKSWNFRLSCIGVIEKIHSMLKGFTKGKTSRFEVYYDRVRGNANDPSRSVQTIACSTDESSKPSIYERTRDVSTDTYLDSEYIRKGDCEIQCFTEHEEVQLMMQNRNQPGVISHSVDKYNQLYFVPVLCRKKKLIGVLVIACLNDTSLAETKKDAESLIRKAIEPYLKLLVVFYKLDIVFGLQPVYEV